jgi:hypothetical protein
MPLAALAAALTLAAGCAQVVSPSDSQLAVADYGAEPTMTEAEAAIKRFHAAYLKDPGAAQYRGWSQPVKYWFGTRDASTYGYLVCVSINGKNSFGAYTGFQTDGFLLRNGSVARHFPRGWYGSSGKVCP